MSQRGDMVSGDWKYASLFASLERGLVNADRADLPAIIGELERVKAELLARMLVPQCGEARRFPMPQAHAKSETRYLTVQEAVDRYHVSARWLYRNKNRLPHSQPSRKVLLFPEEPLRRWFEKMA